MTDAVTARSLPVTAAYINYCFITGHILWAFISSINHSSLLISWFICAIFQTWIISKLSRGTSSPACWWMGNSVDRKPVFSSPSSGVSVQRAFPIDCADATHCSSGLSLGTDHGKNSFPGSSKLVFYTTHAFYVLLSLTIISFSIRML